MGLDDAPRSQQRRMSQRMTPRARKSVSPIASIREELGVDREFMGVSAVTAVEIPEPG